MLMKRWRGMNRKSDILGDEFIRCVNKCIQSVERHPKMYPTVYRRMRRALVETFPYQVLYEIHPDEIVVYAVYHGVRDPKGWKRRLAA